MSVSPVAVCIRHLGFFLHVKVILLIGMVKAVQSLQSGDCSETRVGVKKLSLLTQNKGLCHPITFTQETTDDRKAKKQWNKKKIHSA